MKVLFAGCGDIGCRTALLLAPQHACSGFKRNPQTLPDFISPLAGSMGDSDRLPTILDQAFDVVIATLTPDSFTEAGYQKAYVDSARALVTAITRAAVKPKLVIWVSSTSVYGNTDGDWVDEHSEAAAETFSGKLLRQAEQEIEQLPCAKTVVRFSGIYGPGRTRLLNQVMAGKGRPAQPQQWSNRIHSDDCAGVLAHLVDRFFKGETLEAVYLATDCAPATQHDVRHWLAEQMAVPLRDEIAEETAVRRCSNQRLLASGYEFIYPTYKEGYLALLAAR
ncbi:MAG: hypothetical protein NWS91_05255 [Alphaproteobacteria bacterium]|nr:MAG: hypothetical protein ABS23_00825 [SAR92 bacterium BACL16 MAG-120619-bin48]MDP4654602.1 hypothetical protein [Alphaproteobacteria bacterium]